MVFPNYYGPVLGLYFGLAMVTMVIEQTSSFNFLGLQCGCMQVRGEAPSIHGSFTYGLLVPVVQEHIACLTIIKCVSSICW